MNKICTYIFFAFLLVLSLNVTAQQTANLNASTHGSTIVLNNCNFTLYDSGGPNGNYSDSENYTITICTPNRGFPIHLDVSITAESTSFDYMYIYEGESINGTTIANRIGSSSSGTTFQQTYDVEATCVTIQWHSDGSVNNAGFEINVSCGIACQEFTIEPLVDLRYNAEEERYEACPGEEFTFGASGTFPNNDQPQGYHQSNENLNWLWSWTDIDGNHEFGGVGENILNVEMDPGAYFINMQATDINGCTYIYPEPIFVAISFPPTFTGTTATPIVCPDEVVLLEGHVQQPSEFIMQIPEVNYEQHCFDDFHVDQEQTSCFVFNQFAPGSTIQSVSDIERVGMNMEHSFMGDLDIYIQCPSGRRVQLFRQACSGGYFGEAVDYDGEGNNCNAGPEWVGVGYDYFWTMSNNNGLMSDHCPGSANPLPSGDYQPVGSFQELVGCPINGEWCVIFVDNIGIDDGTVFSVELHFADRLIPLPENSIRFQNTYDVSPTSESLNWAGENVAQHEVATTTAIPTTPGQYEYVFEATDNFGCTYEHTELVTVRQLNDPSCCVMPEPNVFQSASVCENRYMLSARPLPNGNQGTWSVVSTPAGGSATFAAPNAPTTNVFVDTWGVYTFRWTEAYLGNYETCAKSSDIIVEFYPQPNNAFTYVPVNCYNELTTINYTGNMLTQGSVANNARYYWDFDGGIVESGTGSGPYQVRWQNENEEAEIHAVTLHIEANGCVSEDTVVYIATPANMTGEISVVDDRCAHFCEGSATINVDGGTLPYSYSWDSPTNTIVNLCEGNYDVVVRDANGCSVAFEYSIRQPDELSVGSSTVKDLSCFRSYDGRISIQMEGGTGALTYLWSDVGISGHRRNYLPAGNYTVTVIDENSCSLSREFVVTQPDRLILTANNNSAVCEETPSLIQAAAIGGTLPYTFNWSALGNSQLSATLPTTNEFTITLHDTTSFSVYVTDANGCQSNTQTFTVEVSPKMTIDSILLEHNKCFGERNGRAEIVMTGGAQPFTYTWPSPNHILTGLSAGLYTVTVVDKIGCTAKQHFIIEQPTQMRILDTVTSPASCGNVADGQAIITIQGGVPNPEAEHDDFDALYNYLWDNDERTHQITATPGLHTVTITDANECRFVETLNVGGPTPIIILPIPEKTLCNSGLNDTIRPSVYGGTPFYSYKWFEGDSVVSLSNLLIYQPSNTTYTLEVTDRNGCSEMSAPFIINVHPELNIRAVTTSYDTICPNDGAIINVIADGGNGGPYTLTIDNNLIVPTPFTVTLDTTTMVHITLSDMCGTKPVSDSILINVRPNPDTLFTISELIGCQPFTTSFTPFYTAAQTLWEFGDYAFSDERTPSHTYKKPGTFSVSLEMTDDFGCHFYKTYNDVITVLPKPEALFETNPEITGRLDAEIHFINYSTGAVNYYWYFGDNDSSVFETPRHIYRKLGEFEIMLIAESEDMCRDTTTRTLTIQNDFAFYAPDAFTPNGDGVNDYFHICGNGITNNDYKLYIYDRWGALVFKSSFYDATADCDAYCEGAWDGTDWGNKKKGDKVCKAGIYQWYCTFQDWNGVIHNKQGTVMLIK